MSNLCERKVRFFRLWSRKTWSETWAGHIYRSIQVKLVIEEE